MIERDEKRVQYVLIILILAMVIAITVMSNELDSIMEQPQPPPPPPMGQEYQVAKGMDYSKDTPTFRYYTDDEVREMRNQHPEYIIKVQGRIIKSQEELFEERLEEYLDENPDALDEYRDR